MLLIALSNTDPIISIQLILLLLLYVTGQTIIFLPCGFFFLSFYLSFFPRLISAIADWMSAILAHMVSL